MRRGESVFRQAQLDAMAARRPQVEDSPAPSDVQPPASPAIGEDDDTPDTPDHEADG